MLSTSHWNDPRSRESIDPALLSRVIARREDRLVLLEGAPSKARQNLLHFLEQGESRKKMYLSTDSFRSMLWEYINYPQKVIKRMTEYQVLYIDGLDSVIPSLCQPITDSFIEFFEDIQPYVSIVATTQTRPHHILRQLHYYGYDYCIYRYI